MAELFDRCYERRPNGFDAPTYQLVSLPATGAIDEQDAWTMRALAWVRDVKNRLEQDRMNEAMKKREQRQASVAAEMADA